jgi:hypothetical protein
MTEVPANTGKRGAGGHRRSACRTRFTTVPAITASARRSKSRQPEQRTAKDRQGMPGVVGAARVVVQLAHQRDRTRAERDLASARLQRRVHAPHAEIAREPNALRWLAPEQIGQRGRVEPDSGSGDREVEQRAGAKVEVDRVQPAVPGDTLHIEDRTAHAESGECQRNLPREAFIGMPLAEENALDHHGVGHHLHGVRVIDGDAAVADQAGNAVDGLGTYSMRRKAADVGARILLVVEEPLQQAFAAQPVPQRARAGEKPGTPTGSARRTRCPDPA